MSSTIKLVAPAALLFQPGDDKKSIVANAEIKVFEPNSICEPEQRLWKLSARAASPRVRDHRGLDSRSVSGARDRCDSQLFC